MMPRTAALPFSVARAPIAREEIACWAAGLGFTFALFFTLSHLEKLGQKPPTAEIQDMPVVSLPFEPPPPEPKLTEVAKATEEVPPLTGIDAGPSDSPIKITVAPPDLEALLPNANVPPRATVSFNRVYTDLKPQVEIQVDANHVYQRTEVDQPPRAIVRVTPVVPTEVFGTAPSLVVNLVLVIDTNGHAESARVAKPSGKPIFDSIVAQTVLDEWVFSPAIKRGKKVRCLAEQPFRVVISGGGTPFEVR